METQKKNGKELKHKNKRRLIKCIGSPLDPETVIVPDFVTEDIKELANVLNEKNLPEDIVEVIVEN